MANTLAYFNSKLITIVKSFTGQAQQVSSPVNFLVGLGVGWSHFYQNLTNIIINFLLNNQISLNEPEQAGVFATDRCFTQVGSCLTRKH